jgi:hypothetical protein
MKTNDRKILQLINHGFSGSLLSDLNENQINALHSRLSEQVTPLPPKPGYKVGPNGGTIPDNPSGKGYAVKKNPSDNTVTVTPMEEDSDSGDLDLALALQSKEVTEKFESKKQQKYFFAKCGDGKTKEQKKWCKMAEEFAEKTNFKKLPEKKQETKEGYMDMLGKSMNNNMKNKVNDITPSFSMGENELEKSIMRLVEKHISPKISKKEFLSLVSEPKSKENKK